jgi:hypothetical protein
MSIDRAIYNFIRRGKMPFMQGSIGSGPISIDSSGAMVKTGVGREFFVAGNWGSDTNDGSSWDKAFLTLAAAITANNADVAADKYGWATRNRIYLSADPTTESLTEFPAKCDVIGVGSCDAYHMPTIKGRHASTAEHLGCRWFNIRFRPEANGDVFTLSAYDNGMGFYGCQGVGVESGITTSNFIVTAACELLTVMDCDLDGAFANEVIYIGTGNASGLKIIGNRIREGAGDGIYIKTDATFSGVNGAGLIDKNVIHTAAVTINDVSQKCLVTRNRCISDAASGTGGVGAFVANTKLCSDNQITAAGITFMYPLAFDADGTT